MLACIFAIGIAFGASGFQSKSDIWIKENQSSQFVRINNDWHPVTVDCQEGNEDCFVIYSEDPSATPYQVYNSRDLRDPAKGNGEIKLIEGQVPSGD